MNKRIKVIDLFAGPGGLGEGFSAYKNTDGTYPFQTEMSVEMEASAHKTLTTRAFYRKIRANPTALEDYYKYLRGDGLNRDELFLKYPLESAAAITETLEAPTELGKDNEKIHSRLHEVLKGYDGVTIVIGGPPCQAYSLAGRSRNAGNLSYQPAKDKRHFLYKEYLKVIAIAKPDIFVMENVRGILSAKIDDEKIFPTILNDLRNPGKATKNKKVPNYRIFSLVVPATDSKNPIYENSSDFLIKSENYGVPQARHRVILLGIRSDIKLQPDILNLAIVNNITVKSMISDLPKVRSGLSREKEDSLQNWKEIINKNGTLLSKYLKSEYQDQSIPLLKALPGLSRGESYMKMEQYGPDPAMPIELQNWLFDYKLAGALNHSTRGHMPSDLQRYAFCGAYAQLNNGVTPKSKNFPDFLAPKHANWKSGKHADRFRVQSANKFSTTITSHISKDGHYFIHYDPQQCRSLTVREAARLQTFPDNYYFEGERTQQYVQVGNAVPPFLAKQIAEIVYKLLM
jgi:DNA (cytosine-5)-methyltransferase 1